MNIIEAWSRAWLENDHLRIYIQMNEEFLVRVGTQSLDLASEIAISDVSPVGIRCPQLTK